MSSRTRFVSQLEQIPILAVGDAHPQFRIVQDFLARHSGLDAFEPGVFDELSRDALIRYQTSHDLEESGLLDETTKAFMGQPRCAFPDGNPLAFKVACGWEKKNVTFAWSNGTTDLAGDAERDPIRTAFGTWQDVIDVTFTEVALSASPDIEIDWRPEADTDLDMTGTTIAHADYPPKCSVVVPKGSLPLPLHFDDSDSWSLDGAAGTIDIESIALHEIGHLLGLEHSVSGTIMFDTFPGGTLRALTKDDIDGAVELYGPRSRRGLLAFWKGAGSDQRLFVNSSSDGDTFTRQQVLSGAGGSSARPATAVLGGKLLVFWKGANDDQRIFFNSSTDGVNFTEQSILPGSGGTSDGPTAAVIGSTVYVFWKGAGADGRLFFNSSTDGLNFTPQKMVPGTGGSSHSPAAVVMGKRLYLAWKGAGDDGRLFFNSSVDGESFSTQAVIPGTGGTSQAPSLAGFNNYLFAFWKGAGDDNRLFFCKSPDGATFNEQSIVPGTGGSSHGPSAAAISGRLHVAWKGAGGDDRVFHNSSPDGISFTEQSIVPGIGGSSNGPCLIAFA